MTQACGADDGGDAPATPNKLRRLRKRAEFLFVAQGMSAARGAVVVQARLQPGAADPATGGAPARDLGVGFTATKKVGGSVVRNRAKRRLREAARALLPLHGAPGCDYVFVARAGTATRPWPRFLDDVKSALISLGAGGDAPRPPRSRPTSSSSRQARSKPASPRPATKG